MVGRRAVSQELLLLGERIRSQRIKLCLSQEALAEKAGISANTVSRIEGGQMSMGIETFIKLAQAEQKQFFHVSGEHRQYTDLYLGFLFPQVCA